MLNLSIEQINYLELYFSLKKLDINVSDIEETFLNDIDSEKTLHLLKRFLANKGFLDSELSIPKKIDEFMQKDFSTNCLNCGLKLAESVRNLELFYSRLDNIFNFVGDLSFVEKFEEFQVEVNEVCVDLENISNFKKVRVENFDTNVLDNFF